MICEERIEIMTEAAAMSRKQLPARAHRRGRAAGRGERGFTLLETVIAMIVMMTVGLGASALFLYSISNNSAASARTQSLAVAQQEMERLRSVPWDDALLNTTATPVKTTIVTGGNAGNGVTDSRSTFNVSKTVVTQNSATVKQITLTVVPVINNAPWAVGGVTIVTTRATPQTGPN
jgi:Tfp pilus assembly protein PilV